MKRRPAWIVGLSAGWIPLLQTSVWAAQEGRIPDEDGGWKQWGIALGAGALVCITGFLNSKRSHLT